MPPKLLKKIIEQISTPLAKVYTLSPEERIHYRPVSLTSVVSKLLETLIRDHMVEFIVKQINKYISTWDPKSKVMSS